MLATPTNDILEAAPSSQAEPKSSGGSSGDGRKPKCQLPQIAIGDHKDCEIELEASRLRSWLVLYMFEISQSEK